MELQGKVRGEQHSNPFSCRKSTEVLERVKGLKSPVIFTVSQTNESLYRLERAPHPDGHSCNAYILMTEIQQLLLAFSPFSV